MNVGIPLSIPEKSWDRKATTGHVVAGFVSYPLRSGRAAQADPIRSLAAKDH